MCKLPAFLLSYVLLLSCNLDHPDVTNPPSPISELPARLKQLVSDLKDRKIDFTAAADTLDSWIPRDTLEVDPQRSAEIATLLFSVGKPLINDYPAYARLFLQMSLSIRQKLANSNADILETGYRLVVACKQEKAYAEALSYMGLLESLNPDKYSETAFKNRLRAGQIYQEMKEPAIALERLHDAIDDIPLCPSLSLWIKTDLMVYASYCYRDLGNLKEALAWGERALEEKGAPQLESDEAGRIQIALSNAWNDSIIRIDAANKPNASKVIEKAIKHYNNAKNYYTKGGYIEEVARLSGNLGELYRRAGMKAEAEAELSGTLVDFGASTPTVLAQLNINLGETKFDRGNIEDALQCYNNALGYLCPAYEPGKNNALPTPGYSGVVLNRNYLAILLADMADACFTLYTKRRFAS
jgi:tetratricopeptide (TPR) repeat protein